MAFGRRAEIDRLENQRDRNHDCADDHQQPEDIDIGEQIDLLLQRLSDPGDRLRRGVGGVRSLRAWKKRVIASMVC
jgi:hypothetical protein